jgi:glycosyltransferase involved in cell wall biosynthesis
MDSDIPPPRRRTLFLSHLYPSFGGSGTQIRGAALIRTLAAREDVFLVILTRRQKVPGPRDAEMESLCREVHYVHVDMPVETDRNGGNSDPSWARVSREFCEPHETAGALKKFCETRRLDALFVFRLDSCALIAGSLDDFPPASLDLDELDSRRNELILNLRARNGEDSPDPATQRAQITLRLMEKTIIPRFGKVFVSSEEEARRVRLVTGARRVAVLPNVFPSRSPARTEPPPHPREILFVGNLSYYPNEDAVRHFGKEVWPLLQKALEDSVVFRVVGMGCSPSLLEWRDHPGVRFMGYQEDLSPWYARASLVVAPLRAGGGTRIKILEAFSHGCPVVSTTLGAEGLKVSDGENILLADAPEAFAEACCAALTQPGLAARLARAGHRLHGENYTLKHLMRGYDAAMADDFIKPGEEQ